MTEISMAAEPVRRGPCFDRARAVDLGTIIAATSVDGAEASIADASEEPLPSRTETFIRSPAITVEMVEFKHS